MKKMKKIHWLCLTKLYSIIENKEVIKVAIDQDSKMTSWISGPIDRNLETIKDFFGILAVNLSAIIVHRTNKWTGLKKSKKYREQLLCFRVKESILSKTLFLLTYIDLDHLIMEDHSLDICKVEERRENFWTNQEKKESKLNKSTQIRSKNCSKSLNLYLLKSH
jgi:hypothetical protein